MTAARRAASTSATPAAVAGGGSRAIPSARSAVAGAVAAATALGIGELAAGVIPGASSLVVEIGDEIIKLTPGGVERSAISSVGRADTPLLLTSIVLVAVVLGALFGRVGARRFRSGAAGFVAFATVGVVVALQDRRLSVAGTVLVGIIAAAVGVGVLRLLLNAATPVAEPQKVRAGAYSRVGPDGVDRRGFLRIAMSAAVVAGIGAVGGKVLAGRDRVAAIRAAIKIPVPKRAASAVPPGADLAIAGLAPLFVPNRDFYRIDTALIVPQVDTGNWSMQIGGKVDRPLRLRYDELLAMPQIEADVTLSCVSNEIGGGLVGNARWQGVPLRDLLDRVGVQAGGTQIVGKSVDGFTAGFPTPLGMQQDAMVALFMNGEPLPARHGFPARLVVPGLYGYVSATKWLSSIELADDSVDGYWIRRGWSKLGPIKTQSRIDVPGGSSIRAGRTPIAGVAWAPTRGIERVEVSIDQGPWLEARLAASLGVESWRQWVYDWTATRGEHEISVRATDGTGVVQTAERTDVAPNGESGHHTITVNVT
jgi:DMSO/TMAO reductase YedYZ molybdopterin-dependent catalytic subunit